MQWYMVFLIYFLTSLSAFSADFRVTSISNSSPVIADNYRSPEVLVENYKAVAYWVVDMILENHFISTNTHLLPISLLKKIRQERLLKIVINPQKANGHSAYTQQIVTHLNYADWYQIDPKSRAFRQMVIHELMRTLKIQDEDFKSSLYLENSIELSVKARELAKTYQNVAHMKPAESFSCDKTYYICGPEDTADVLMKVKAIKNPIVYMSPDENHPSMTLYTTCNENVFTCSYQQSEKTENPFAIKNVDSLILAGSGGSDSGGGDFLTVDFSNTLYEIGHYIGVTRIKFINGTYIPSDEIQEFITRTKFTVKAINKKQQEEIGAKLLPSDGVIWMPENVILIVREDWEKSNPSSNFYLLGVVHSILNRFSISDENWKISKNLLVATIDSKIAVQTSLYRHKPVLILNEGETSECETGVTVRCDSLNSKPTPPKGNTGTIAYLDPSWNIFHGSCARSIRCKGRDSVEP